MAYAYRVTKAFKRVGDDGECQFSPGDTLVLDRPAKSLSHLEMIAPADDGATVTVGVLLAEDGGDTATGDGTGKALPVIIDELRSQAAALGLKVDGRWSRERLIAEIEKAQA